VKVERLGLGHATWQVAIAPAGGVFDDHNVFHAAIDLVGRRVEHDRVAATGASGLEDVEGPECIDVEVFARVGHRRSDRHLTGEVDNRVGVGERLGSQRGIADVAATEHNLVAVAPLEPREIVRRART